MAFSNILILSVLTIFLLTLFGISCAHSRAGPHIRSVGAGGFMEMNLAAARNFGKRAINKQINSILKEWIELENRMKELRMPKQTMEMQPEDENPLLERNYYV